VLAIARELRLDRSAARRRLRKAEDLGFVTNLETRRYQPGRYVVTDRADDEVEMMPTVETLARAYEAALDAEEEAERAKA
jgi:predicted transcriptional regulator